MKMYEYWNDRKWVKVIFHGIFQRSKIIPPSMMIGGDEGGTISYPIAIIEDEKGLHEVEVWRIRGVQE